MDGFGEGLRDVNGVIKGRERYVERTTGWETGVGDCDGAYGLRE